MTHDVETAKQAAHAERDELVKLANDPGTPENVAAFLRHVADDQDHALRLLDFAE